MKEVIKKLQSQLAGRSDYFRDIFNQAGLVILAQLIPVLFSPLLSRIYEENAMAEITGLMALTSLLLMFSTFKLENAIVIEEDNQNARDLILLGSMVAAVFSLLSFLLLEVFGDLVVGVFKIESVVKYLPLYIFFFSILNILNSWYVRIRRFKMKAYSKIVENAGYILIAVMIYALIGQNEFGLAAGKMSGILIALLVLAAVSNLKVKWRPGGYASLLSKHREFPLHYMPVSFVNTLGLQMLILFIGAYYQKEDLGYFGLANMVIIMPISVMTQSVGTIFFQKTSESVNQGRFEDVKSLFFQTGGLLALVAVPAFLILFFGSTYLFPVIFGSNWHITGIIAKFLSLVFLAQIIVGPLSIVLISLKRIRLNALWQYGRFGIMLIYLLFLVHIKELAFIEFIEWYSYGAAIMYACYLLIIYYVVKDSGDVDRIHE